MQIEPHLSITGATSAEWVPIRPKTDAAFLFGLIHHILHERKWEEVCDLPCLKQRTNSPYLIGPNGWFLRDPASEKPLIFDLADGKAKPYGASIGEPALAGTFRVSGIEIGPDDARNAPVPEGRAGELVITTLTKEALPMLRYRTRDITRVTRAPCDCGRTHLRILRITGRTDDMLIIRGVNVYPSQVEAVLIGAAHIAPHYQLVVERRGSLDHMTVEVEVRHGVGPDAFEAIAREVAHSIKSLIGITTDVVVKKPDEIPRSQGKAVRVRDLRPRG